MIIELRNVGFVNKGAELMLVAVMERVSKEFPDARFAIRRSVYDPNHKIKEYGLLSKIGIERTEAPAIIQNVLPDGFMDRFGLVRDDDVDVVLDVSGFAYGDQWGPRNALETCREFRKWASRDRKVVFMPQAFGPFSTNDIIESMREICNGANLLFARDERSHANLTQIAGDLDNVRMAPDFTNAVEGVVPVDYEPGPRPFCIIPNSKMVSETERAVSDVYVNFLAKCVNRVHELGFQPLLIVHGGKEDLRIAKQIAIETGNIAKVMQEDDPKVIKGLIGACQGCIASRFHGLVSALSQGVPALGAGWSHKYEMLFNSYGFPEGVVSPLIDEAELMLKIGLVTSEESAKEVSRRLLHYSDAQKKAVREMWLDVFEVLG